MSEFKRGLDENFISQIKDLSKISGLWNSLVKDKDIFLGIRNNCIDAYYKGNCLISLEFKNGKLTGKTHYKYLLQSLESNDPKCYVHYNYDSHIDLSASLSKEYLLDYISDIQCLKTASNPYSGVEKTGVHKILKANNNIVDIEIALTKEGDDNPHLSNSKRKNTAPRIDFAALRQMKDGIVLQFYEAKHFSNKELRSTRDPKVLSQIEEYEKLLKMHESNICSSYKTICKNLCVILPKDRLNPVIIDINKGKEFKLLTRPSLVIYGFDDDQKNGNVWKIHHNKLKDKLGKERVLMKGDCTDFINGIKSSTKP